MSAIETRPRHGTVHAGRKIGRILRLLKSGQTLNRFEAEAHGDHCLNSTIADLRAEGHRILDVWEHVPNRMGSLVRVKRYRYAQVADNASAGQGIV